MTLPPFITKVLARFRKTGPVAPNPARDWHIMIALFVVLIVVSIGWNVWFFLAVVSQEPTVGTAVSTEPQAADSVTKARELFDKRTTEADHYRTDYRFNDPSK